MRRKRIGRGAPALIVFAREPIPGMSKTRLIPLLGAGGAAHLADAFIIDALAKAAAFTDCTLVIAGSSPDTARASSYFKRLARRFGAELIDQGEGDLGKRMARVLKLCANPAGAILFGTDTPSMPPAFIRRSIDDLREAPVVIAPVLDGGYYLVGAREPVPRIFNGIAWGGSRVFAQTLQRLASMKIPYRIGHWWYDIDRAADLEFMAADLARAGNGLRCVCPATSRLMREMGLLGAVRTK